MYFRELQPRKYDSLNVHAKSQDTNHFSGWKFRLSGRNFLRFNLNIVEIVTLMTVIRKYKH